MLDAAVERLVADIVARVNSNLSLLKVYKSVFLKVAQHLHSIIIDSSSSPIPFYKSVFLKVAQCLRFVVRGSEADSSEANLAKAIYEVGAKYNYEGAYVGEFNYAFTRLIQRVPQLKVANGDWAQELRYWLYDFTVEALTSASYKTEYLEIGVSGVFEDIKDEYKRRVNTAYEAEQILKSGDCYNAPYYTRLVEVVDETGKLIGYQEIMLKRNDATLGKDLLDFQMVVKKK